MRKQVLALALSLVPQLALAQSKAAVGKPAPEFSLPSVMDGKGVALRPLIGKNKAVVVMFIATKCPYSNAYNERMAQLSRDYADKGVAIVGINANKTESAADTAQHARANHFTFVVVKDEGAKVADAYGAQHTPEAYVVDKNGTLVYHGRIDEKYDDPQAVKSPDLRNALDQVLAGQAVKTPETKAFGCSIKR
jgi:peroxiredoxin